MRIKHYAITMALALSVLTAARAQTPPPLPTPKEFFGFNIGDNYMLANYTQGQAYLEKLAAASDRCRDQFMLVIPSPENLKKPRPL